MSTDLREVLVRPATEADTEAIRAVHLIAFQGADEADLVERLQRDGDSEISLVAHLHGEILGHALLSRMEVTGDGRAYRALGLGPVAVRPWAQDGGVGRALVRTALAEAEALGVEVVFVVGDPDIYYRFGFSSEAAEPFSSPYAGSWFMAQWLRPPSAAPRSGSAAYAPAFAALDSRQ
jgi:putative acetyltransferase